MMAPINMACDLEKADIQDDFIKDDDFQSQSSMSLLKPQKTLKELMRICKSRTEMKLIWDKYKCYVISSAIALLGLIISLRMVSLQHQSRSTHL